MHRWPQALAAVFLLALGIPTWALVRTLLTRVDERWPQGQTVVVRQFAEALLPPYPGATFTDVRIRQSVDESYTECVLYRTGDPPPLVVQYYRVLFEQKQWPHWVSPSGMSLYTVEGLVVLPTITSVPATVPRADGRLSIQVFPIASSAEYRVQVCSRSFAEAQRTLGA